MRPRIAVTSCQRPHDYDASVRRAGGDPFTPIVETDDPADVVARADGLLLTGGDDVDPAWYAEVPHPTYSAAEPGRDTFEIAVARRAIAEGLPVLAICRGLQVLNVACGGSLIQDIPSEPGPHHVHSLYPPSTIVAHEVQATPGSLLATLAGSTSAAPSLRVNSRHHQAARRIGHGLRVTAVSADGIVEALEVPTHPFCLAVQWHPESFHETGEFGWLFEALTRAALVRAALA